MQTTTAETPLDAASSPAPNPVKGRSLWNDAWRRLKRDRLAMACLGVIACYSLVALLIPFGLIAKDWALEVGSSYQPPSFEHWKLVFGADIFGRSVLMKMIYGAYVSMVAGLFSCLVAIPIGVILGALAGYFGGWVDDIITWVYTTISNIPTILTILSLAFVLGKGLNSIVIALGLTGWVSICRLIRGEFMKHKEREYVQAAKALGAGHPRRIFLHILPNVSHLIIINISFFFVGAIKTEVILSYLGLGVQGIPSWGTMIDEAKLELARGVWWQLGAATFAMFFVILALNIFGDALRDALDPKLK
ncbi:MAG: ABC transporter permease [Bdellovibrionales bacterium]|nr:ABC transporter permease [Bdellovibrionales bacterium]